VPCGGHLIMNSLSAAAAGIEYADDREPLHRPYNESASESSRGRLEMLLDDVAHVMRNNSEARCIFERLLGSRWHMAPPGCQTRFKYYVEGCGWLQPASKLPDTLAMALLIAEGVVSADQNETKSLQDLLDGVALDHLPKGYKEFIHDLLNPSLLMDAAAFDVIGRAVSEGGCGLLDLMRWLDSQTEGGAFQIHKRIEDYLRPLKEVLEEEKEVRARELFGEALRVFCDGDMDKETTAITNFKTIIQLHVDYITQRFADPSEGRNAQVPSGWGRDPALRLPAIANNDAAWAVQRAKELLGKGQDGLLSEAAAVLGVAQKEGGKFTETTPDQVRRDINTYDGPLQLLLANSELWRQLQLFADQTPGQEVPLKELQSRPLAPHPRPIPAPPRVKRMERAHDQALQESWTHAAYKGRDGTIECEAAGPGPVASADH